MSANHASRTATASPDSTSHENEGFLKSMWHTLTNHPAHQNNPAGEAETKPTASEDKTKKDGQTKDEPKKASDSSSG